MKILNEKGRVGLGKVHSNLHNEQKQLQNKLTMLQKAEYERYKQGQKALISKTVDKNSDLHLQNKFIQEFDTIIDDQLNLGPEIYLIDVFEDLKFLKSEYMTKNFKRIEELLTR